MECMESFTSRFLQYGTPVGSQGNLLLCGILSPWVCGSRQELVPAQALHRVRAFLQAPTSSSTGLLHGLQADLWRPMVLRGLQEHTFPENKAHFLGDMIYFDQSQTSVLFTLLPAPLLTLWFVIQSSFHTDFSVEWWFAVWTFKLCFQRQGNYCGRFSCSLNFLFWCPVTVFTGFRFTLYKPFIVIICFDLI